MDTRLDPTVVRGHRPWPPPRDPWVQRQTWANLLFAHWPVDAAVMRRLVPAQLPLDLHEGQAWLGLVPFYMRGVRPRGVPAVPYFSDFPELNLRTYVTVGGKPGVWFFSLDTTSMLAVVGARLGYFLPYFRARMRVRREGEWVRYASDRAHPGAPPASLRARYRPVGPTFSAVPGTLDYFLTERYCLYAVDTAGRVLRADIHHPPWALQRAEAEIDLNTMAAPIGLALADPPTHLHFSARQDMVAWWRRGVG